MARVERRLPATDLAARKINIEARLAQNGFSVRDCAREHEIPEACCEKLSPAHEAPTQLPARFKTLGRRGRISPVRPLTRREDCRCAFTEVASIDLT